MHFKIYEQLEYVSKYLTLEAGDIILTGSPENSGPVEEGDLIEASLLDSGKVIANFKDTIQKDYK